MSTGSATRRALERGASLIELMIYLTVMAIVGIPIVMVTMNVSRASAEGDMLSRIQERNRAAIQRILSEYQEALSGTTTISADGKSLQFTSNGGFDGAGVIAGPVIRYEIRMDPGESANGVDDDNDGLIDEGSLVRVDQALGQGLILTSALKTSDSSFTLTGSGAAFTLTTFGRTQGAKAETAIQRSITIIPRN